jgi:uncharacterized protein (TIGR02145 family)
MRKLLTLLALCTVAHLALAQTTMNIYQSNGSVLQIPVNTIDSITYTITGGNIPDYLNPNLTYGSVTDIDGNVYATIIIGSQEWMAENLRVARYANGQFIPNIQDDNTWINLSTGAWVYPDNDAYFNTPHGKLYNWYAVDDSRNLCPVGWHVPSSAEWNQLIFFLDPNALVSEVVAEYMPQSSLAGDALKHSTTQYWGSSNNATNTSGFSAMPGGHRNGFGGAFQEIGSSGLYWSSTVNNGNTTAAAYRRLFAELSDIYLATGNKKNGLSVRCVRD